MQLLADPKIKKLWGVEQPVGFPRMMITLCIYKDLSGYGYAKILSLINFRFQIKKKSFIHNCKLVQKLLYLWAHEKVKNEGCDAWNSAATLLPKKRGLDEVNLLMDSCDFQLAGKASTLHKDPAWSYKLNSPGQ